MNMTISLDLDAYFERVRWGGETRPTFETLAGLLRAHMTAIPFENLDVLLGRKVRLDLEFLQDKLIRRRRGGYCFEHATLFAAILESLGFQPVRHAARVTLFASRAEAPRTHMFLTLPLAGGVFVLDPGFGGLAPRAPIPLRDGGEARLDHEAHRMIRDGSYWVLRALTDGGRVTVMNRDVTIWRGNTSRVTQLADRAALRAVLDEHFGFDLPEVEALRVPSISEWG